MAAVSVCTGAGSGCPGLLVAGAWNPDAKGLFSPRRARSRGAAGGGPHSVSSRISTTSAPSSAAGMSVMAESSPSVAVPFSAFFFCFL